MTLGSSFSTIRDGEWLDCEVVWTGGMPLTPYTTPWAADLAISPQSALKGLGETPRTGQTAGGMGHGRTPARSFSQSALRA